MMNSQQIILSEEERKDFLGCEWGEVLEMFLKKGCVENQRKPEVIV
jgi:hypothetical protein